MIDQFVWSAFDKMCSHRDFNDNCNTSSIEDLKVEIMGILTIAFPNTPLYYSINRIRKDIFSSFLEACQRGNIGACEFILKSMEIRREDVWSKRNKALRKACEGDDLEVVEWLMEKFDLKIVDLLRDCRYELIISYINGNKRVIEWLENKMK